MPVIYDSITCHNVFGLTFVYQGLASSRCDLINRLVIEGYSKRHATKIVDDVVKEKENKRC